MIKRLILCFIILGFSFSNLAKAKADSYDMKNFLLACAYGTAGGAALGLLTVAFSDDPDGKLNRVAKGASLGLYAGIGLGLYMINIESQPANHEDYGQRMQPQNISPVWISLNTQAGKIDGADLHLTISQFLNN